jgi:hypothetical protein
MNKVVDFLPYILGAYEVISHIVPTKNNNSILHKVFKILAAVSTVLNREKKSGKPFPNVLPLLILITVSLTACETVKTSCVHQSFKTVTILLPDSSYQTVQLPFCDTIRFSKVPKELKD